LEKGGAGVMAEAAYILLSNQGETDGHEIIRRLTLEAENSKKPFIDVLKSDPKVWAALESGLAQLGGLPAKEFFADPKHYRGKAAEKSRDLSKKWKQEMQTIEKEIR